MGNADAFFCHTNLLSFSTFLLSIIRLQIITSDSSTIPLTNTHGKFIQVFSACTRPLDFVGQNDVFSSKCNNYYVNENSVLKIHLYSEVEGSKKTGGRVHVENTCDNCAMLLIQIVIIGHVTNRIYYRCPFT